MKSKAEREIVAVSHIVLSMCSQAGFYRVFKRAVTRHFFVFDHKKSVLSLRQGGEGSVAGVFDNTVSSRFRARSMAAATIAFFVASASMEKGRGGQLESLGGTTSFALKGTRLAVVPVVVRSIRSAFSRALRSLLASLPGPAATSASIRIHSTGQGATHRLQPVHHEATTVCICPAAPMMASAGQARMHRVHPMQRCSSMKAIRLVLSCIFAGR